MRRNYQQAVDKLCDLLVIQKEAEAAGAFGALVAVDVHLVGFELVRLLPCDALNVTAALDRQHAVRDGQVFARVFAVCAAHILAARLNVDAVDLDQTGVLIRKAGPDAVLSLDLLGRNHFLRLHQTEILARGFDQPLKLDAQAARDFSQHAEGRVRRSLFDLREHALAHAGLLGRLRNNVKADEVERRNDRDRENGLNRTAGAGRREHLAVQIVHRAVDNRRDDEQDSRAASLRMMVF